MKKVFFLTAIMLLAGMSGIVSVDAQDNQASRSSKVWICTGPYSKKYHNNYDCKGLQKCSADIIDVTISEAKERGYTECKFCYNSR